MAVTAVAVAVAVAGAVAVALVAASAVVDVSQRCSRAAPFVCLNFMGFPEDLCVVFGLCRLRSFARECCFRGVCVCVSV